MRLLTLAALTLFSLSTHAAETTLIRALVTNGTAVPEVAYEDECTIGSEGTIVRAHRYSLDAKKNVWIAENRREFGTKQKTLAWIKEALDLIKTRPVVQYQHSTDSGTISFVAMPGSPQSFELLSAYDGGGLFINQSEDMMDLVETVRSLCDLNVKLYGVDSAFSN